jgi:hypothetical protein
VKITLNPEQQLYVIDCGGGYSCFGYANAQRDTEYIATTLKRDDLAPRQDEFGTLPGYAKYQAACAAWANSINSKRTWFTPGTPRKVCQILESYRQSDRVLRLFMGDKVTGRDWMEENDVVGRIGRSTGSQKVPLLIEPGERGGPAILTDSIVRLMDADGTELYRHASYQPPHLTLSPETDEKMRKSGHEWSVSRDGELEARFPNVYSAAEYVEFMVGRIAVRHGELVRQLRAA